MAKVTLEQIECDVCRKVGERYTVGFPDGIKVLDRCTQHARKILSLRDEPGDFNELPTDGKRRRRLQVMSPAEIAAQQK